VHLRSSTWGGVPARPFVVLVLALAASCTSIGEKPSVQVLTIADVANHPDQYRGRRIQARGFLVIEPENRRLWESAATYGAAQGECGSVEITDALFNQREVLNRREMVVEAIVEVHEGDGRCDGLVLRSIAITSFIAPIDELDAMPRDPEQGWFDVNTAASDAKQLRALAEKVRDILTFPATGEAGVTALVAPRHAVRIEAAWKRAETRIRWLLIDGASSFANLAKQRGLKQIDVVQEPLDGPAEGGQGAVCFCARNSCDARSLSPQRIYFRAAGDPYYCLPVLREGSGWVLDAGYLIGRPDVEAMD
jgi:hypothetical protein